MIGRYNTAQLRSYLGQLQTFTSRRTAFVPGARGVPLHAAQWREFQRIEAIAIGKRSKAFSDIAQIVLPRSFRGMTVKEEMRTYSQKPNRYMPMNHPFGRVQSSKAMTSPEALARAIERYRREAEAAHPMEVRGKGQRDALMKMINNFSDADLKTKIRKLNAAEIDFLYNYTPFISTLRFQYDADQDFLQGKDATASSDAMASQQAEVAHELAAWVRTLNLGS